MSDPIDLDALVALEQAATPGPWEHVRVPFRDTASHSIKQGAAVLALVGWEQEEPERAPADAALIAAARNALPALIDAAREREGLEAAAATYNERIRKVNAERDAARAELAALRERVKAIPRVRLADEEWVQVRDLRAALATEGDQ